MSAHAKRSPSGAAGWLACAGWMSDPVGSSYANEGTAAHFLAATCLERASLPDAADFMGQKIGVNDTEGAFWVGDIVPQGTEVFEVDADMAEAVQRYLDYVDVVSAKGVLMVEQRLDISSITGEAGAHGTSDCVILRDDEIIIVDLKYGRGVQVDAEDNEQLMIYALAAVQEHELTADFSQVRMVIHQPRMHHVSEATLPVADLKLFGKYVKERIAHHDANPDGRSPGEDQCRWCARKASCKALATHVQDTIGADFEDLTAGTSEPAAPADLTDTSLSQMMQATGLIEDWLKAVRAEVEKRLLAGTPVPGYKLVQGRKGARAWANADEAEAYLKKARLKIDEMYELKLLTPAALEKRQKPWIDADGNKREPLLGPRQWPQVLKLITQSEGGNSVAPESDKRPAVIVTPPKADDFDDVSAQAPAEAIDDLL